MSAALQLEVGQCGRCYETGVLIAPLHGERGGMSVCPNCASVLNLQWDMERKRISRLLEGFGVEPKPAASELYLETLEAAVRLCHPDRHPPDREALAQRVTAELLALKPHVRPRPSDVSPEEQQRTLLLPVTDAACGLARRVFESLADASRYPCETCRLTIPKYYCDACCERWDAECLAKRLRDRERQATYSRRHRERVRKRKAAICPVCQIEFIGRRRDAKYCSAKCRQRAHRERAKR